MIRDVNIFREPTTFGSRSPDILTKISKSLGFETIIGRDEGYLHAPDWGELSRQ
jgi:hypothetical protein